jgi:hypothetical protein
MFHILVKPRGEATEPLTETVESGTVNCTNIQPRIVGNKNNIVRIAGNRDAALVILSQQSRVKPPL